ncbi:MAG TPA: hypothetical protein VN643_07580 [Pyrinomonadaceae bacterium]|nr:hypothetical protein [Pyrinomonadaceae bacterium]
MKPTTEAETNPLIGVADALHRAAQRAREIAARTRTPLVFSINGRIEKRWVNNGDPAALREAFEHYLNAVPDAEPSETDRLT